MISVWTFRNKKNRRSMCQIGYDGKDWFVGALRIHPLVLMAEACALMVPKNKRGKPLYQWSGDNGVKTRCSDCLDHRVVAAIDRLIVRCEREYTAAPGGEHGEIKYDNIWNDEQEPPCPTTPTTKPSAN